MSLTTGSCVNVSTGCGMDDPQSMFRLECMGSLHVRRQEHRAINDGTMPLAVRPPFLALPVRGMAGRTAGGSCLSLRIPSPDDSIYRVPLSQIHRHTPRNSHADAASSCGCRSNAAASKLLERPMVSPTPGTVAATVLERLGPSCPSFVSCCTRFPGHRRCHGRFQTCCDTCLVDWDVRRRGHRRGRIRTTRRGRPGRCLSISLSSVGFLCGIRLSTERISVRSTMHIGRSRCFLSRVPPRLWTARRPFSSIVVEDLLFPFLRFLCGISPHVAHLFRPLPPSAFTGGVVVLPSVPRRSSSISPLHSPASSLPFSFLLPCPSFPTLEQGPPSRSHPHRYDLSLVSCFHRSNGTSRTGASRHVGTCGGGREGGRDGDGLDHGVVDDETNRTTSPATPRRTRDTTDAPSEEDERTWGAKDGGTRNGKRRDGIAQERRGRRHHPKDHRQAHARSQLLRCHG